MGTIIGAIISPSDWNWLTTKEPVGHGGHIDICGIKITTSVDVPRGMVGWCDRDGVVRIERLYDL